MSKMFISTDNLFKQIMMKQTYSFFIGVICCVFSGFMPSEISAQQLLPLPNRLVYRSGKFRIDGRTRIYTNIESPKDRLFTETVNELLGMNLASSKGEKKKNQLRLLLTEPAADPERVPFDKQLQSYILDVTKEGITIKSHSEAGIYYGLQTLKGLFAGREVPFVHVEDTPRFAYRGFMIDCSRHFWTVDFIKKQIRMMARLKLNRLHLHLTDAAGWRMEIKHYPELTQKTAYRTHSHWDKWWRNGDRRYCEAGTEGAYGGYYTQDDLREIVRYAALHHITVIPEIDMPGHSEEVTFALPQLSCDGKAYSDLCIGTEETFQFAENVLSEVMDIFPSEYINIGGDEAAAEHWKTCKRCRQRMYDNHLTDVSQLQAYMMKRINRFLNAHGRKIIGWDEMIDGGLPQGSVVMAWRSIGKGVEAIKAGHHVIMSPIDWCYLNFYQDNPFTQPEAMGGYAPLKATYAFEPVPEALTDTAEISLIDGVQANLWTEYVEHADHVEYMTYPRLMAIAEIGWNGSAKDYAAFRERAQAMVDQMRADGYHPFDLRHESGPRKESLTGVSHAAMGKKVTYLSPYSAKYPAAGNTSLTNGKHGDWSYKDGQWQGFIAGKKMDVVIDMGQETELTDISADFMQFAEHWVFQPCELTISVSSDGKNYMPIDHRPSVRDEMKHSIRTYRWEGHAKGRYIRYEAKTDKDGGWLFTDEIVVNKQ